MNLRVQDSDATSITLAWEPAGSIKQYQVAVFTDASRSAELGSKKVSGTAFTIEPLTPNTTYEIGVRAISSGDGTNLDWTYISGTTADGEPRKPSQTPTNPTATSTGADQARIKWEGIRNRIGSSSAVFIEVCQYTDSTYTQMAEGSPHGTSNSYYDWSGLEAGKTYYFGDRSYQLGMIENIYSDWANFSYTHTGKK